jgi:hypothetical protein
LCPAPATMMSNWSGILAALLLNLVRARPSV